MIEMHDELTLNEYKKDAEKLGLSLQEYLLFRILQKMDDLRVSLSRDE